MKQTSYGGLIANVSWNDEMTTKFQLKRGTKEGRIASTTEYLKITTDALQLHIATGISFSIRNYYISALTVVDDTICLALHPHHLQLRLKTLGFNANKEHYDIHPGKFSTSVFNSAFTNPLSETFNHFGPSITNH